MIKAILFDCFGVLTTDYWLAFCDTIADPAAAERAHELNRQYDRGFISQQEFIDQVAEATQRRPSEVAAVFTNDVAKNKELFDYIAELKKRGYKTGIISNVGSDWIRVSFLNDEEHRLFDVTVLSYEIGISKPDARIYLETTNRLNILPAEAVFTDDRQKHIDGAKDAGMHAILFEQFAQFKHDLEELLDSNNEPLRSLQ